MAQIVSRIPGLVRLITNALPGHTRPGVAATTGVLVRMQIRWALRRLNVRPDVVVACSLDDVLIGWAPNVMRVMYVTDDYVAGADLLGLSRRMLVGREQRQLANADLIVAISQTLAEHWSEMGANVVLIPNGVQISAYEQIDSAVRAPDVLLPRPVAGVVGHLSSRIDVSLLEAVSDADCSLLLVGPHDPSWERKRFAKLLQRERVAWVGRRSFEELPGYLRCMDVGLTPYADIPFNRASFPLKTLEYLAAGLPVVSTDLPATRWLNTDLVRIATGAIDFAAATCMAAKETTPGMVQRRREFASHHSWERRADELWRIIGLNVASPHLLMTKSG